MELTECDQCGGVDDHPKAHFSGGRTVHHDCMSRAEEQEARASSDGDKLGKIIDHARSGVHGDDLRTKISRSRA